MLLKKNTLKSKLGVMQHHSPKPQGDVEMTDIHTPVLCPVRVALEKLRAGTIDQVEYGIIVAAHERAMRASECR
jgi:hypothetical protein